MRGRIINILSDKELYTDMGKDILSLADTIFTPSSPKEWQDLLHGREGTQYFFLPDFYAYIEKGKEFIGSNFEELKNLLTQSQNQNLFFDMENIPEVFQPFFENIIHTETLSYASQISQANENIFDLTDLTQNFDFSSLNSYPIENPITVIGDISGTDFTGAEFIPSEILPSDLPVPDGGTLLETIVDKLGDLLGFLGDLL